MEQDFNRRLKTALTGDPGTPLVFLGNFEVEQRWARGELGLPRLSAPGGTAVVNRMDQFALLPASASDHVLVKAPPDPDHLDHLRELGLPVPTVHAVARQDAQRIVTEDVLDDPALLDVLRELAGAGARLAPHGVSELEERLSDAAGLPLAAPGAALCKAVNSKVYSRRAADELGLRQPLGWTCETVAELDAAVAAARELVEAGTKVVVKEAFGVSGKGIAVVDSVRRLDRLHRMLAEKAGNAGGRLAFVVEQWVAKRADLNYQFTVHRDGSVRFDFVKEALTEGGVHKGHRFPASLDADQLAVVEKSAALIGSRLAADGYYGVVGVDALVEPDGELFPLLEINARNNMSTYQLPLQERFTGAGQVALARHHALRLTGPLPFAEVRAALDDLLWKDGTGLVVDNFATVNAAAGSGAPFDGRLYGFLVADSTDRLGALDAEISARLARMGTTA
ncbi:ATP-grasp domain-containing protein [Saccharopolyspora sp. NFXS83]|uniref:preATP grasp domain-containing protein n=1 Tax=Saccharopolyspora sp. NFXS83 TaxID=2993560 RepID=UPI00224AEAD3|nr:ATP-grasp domain-containing protein [Saccharopolyspora sp. NFXS83]MCX2732053.1 ATP-grasp domain-containing protein [Saccharopolyspora sp. NFXS83]